MNWDSCERGFVKNVEVDLMKVDSILDVAEKRLKYIKSANVDLENVSFVIEGYYEIIKELLSVLMLLDSKKSSNHQCLISYFYKIFPEYEYEAKFILRLNFLRNRLNYYGKIMDIEWYDDNLKLINEIVVLLKKLISNKMKK